MNILFHNYAMSPFSEKIRKIFALKKVRYQSVDQPMWMPKPDLTPLTGGYRRIPVMQLGADIYCDTALIARKLEELFPKPSLYPNGNVAVTEAVAAWADRQLFMICVPIVFGALADVLPPELIADRKKMRPDLDVETLRAASPALRGALEAWCTRLDQTLASRKYLLGNAFSLADAAVYHCLWFVRNDPEAAAALGQYAGLGDWMNRIEQMGAGDAEDLPAFEALRIAARSEPRVESRLIDAAPGLCVGARIGVFADDLPGDVVEGQLAALDEDEIVIAREDAKLGKIAVRFPRVGYIFRAA